MDVAAKDPRFAYEAYDFVLKALDFTEGSLGRRGTTKASDEARHQHVKSQELLQGVRTLALREFGLMARTVFHMWGVEATDDFGHLVFRLVDAGLIHKTADETLDDFKDIFDFEEALERGYTIPFDEAR